MERGRNIVKHNKGEDAASTIRLTFSNNQAGNESKCSKSLPREKQNLRATQFKRLEI